VPKISTLGPIGLHALGLESGREIYNTFTDLDEIYNTFTDLDDTDRYMKSLLQATPEDVWAAVKQACGA
jgi:hypothetical protein